ncbi:Fructose-bisphosphate aldolase [Diplocarpon rosae]|nr:Fructose-bisphosphate aldolase [Diplocarpon rosae]
MAPQLVSKAPQCISCIRRAARCLGDVFHLTASHQVRGKKKLTKVSTVKVHLLQNIPGYGRRGSVIPVTAGVMRNIWFPKKMAEYLTLQRIAELGIKKDSGLERDSAFRSNAERRLEKQKEKEKEQEDASEPLPQMEAEQPEEPAPQIELELPSPSQATLIMDQLIPANLDFYRTPIAEPNTPTKRVSPSIPNSSAISAAATKAEAKREIAKNAPIYGSVSTLDIAVNLKAILAEDEDGARVVLSPENVTFVDEMDEKGKVKHLGVFEIDIQVDGATESVRRTIKIAPLDFMDPVSKFWQAGRQCFNSEYVRHKRLFPENENPPTKPIHRSYKIRSAINLSNNVSLNHRSYTPPTTIKIIIMGVTDVLSRKTGVIVGDDVLKLFKYAQEHKFAIPAINVTSSSTVIASLEAARDAKAPIVLQMSQGGAAYFAGKGVANGKQEASIAGGIAGAQFIRAIAPSYGIPVILHTDHCAKKLLPWLDGLLDADEDYFKAHGEPLFSSHMIDLSEETVEYNIETTAKYLKRAAPMKQWLEMEIGITGGEEDGVNNEDVDNNSLYTQPEDILAIYQALSPISPYFSIAAGFGNVHGVYKPGNVKLHPELLGKHQKYVKDAIGAKEEKPVFLVFHGGSGSSKQEFLDAISYGVVKVNLDTDLQYAYLTGIRDYILNKKDYIMSQVGNPDGEDKPNKKYFDPRVWVREGEKTMSVRVTEGLKDFNTAGQL